MAGRDVSAVKIRAEDKCFTVPVARVIVCPRGLFIPDQQLPAGTPVVVQLCGQHELTLLGIVRTTDADSGLVIEFHQSTEGFSERLIALVSA